jgi:hypothetical protein
MTSIEKTKFRNLFLLGDSLSVTVFNESGSDDTLVAAVQFKRTPFGAWINYICTTEKKAYQNAFGNKVDLLPNGTPFRNMGLALTLLRAIQLLQCCNGHAPTLFIRLKDGFQIYGYLLSLGFYVSQAPGRCHDEYAFTALQNGMNPITTPGFNWRMEPGFVVLECKKIVSYSPEQQWKPTIFHSFEYRNKSRTGGLSTWPDDYVLFYFPFETNGMFIDQCARGLSMLGSPFLYFQNQNRLASTKNQDLLRTIITGSKFKSMESVYTGNSQEFLTEEHIQFLVNWVFRDEESIALKQFHCVPVTVTAQITHLFAGATNADTAMMVIHRYCLENWKRLGCFMIFFVRNIHKLHWILDVAVNPYQVLPPFQNCCKLPAKIVHFHQRKHLSTADDILRRRSF